MIGKGRGFRSFVTEPGGIELDQWSDITTYEATVENEQNRYFLTGIHFLRTEKHVKMPGNKQFDYFDILPFYEFDVYPWTKGNRAGKAIMDVAKTQLTSSKNK